MVEDFEIGPLAARKGAAHPNNVTSANAQANFVPQTRALELVRIPAAREGLWLEDSTVRAINGHKAIVADVVDESFLPANLLAVESTAYMKEDEQRDKGLVASELSSKF